MSQQAEAEVRRWREQGQLFQHQFPDEQVKEMTGTLKYPNSGAADGRPPSAHEDGPATTQQKS